MSAVATLPRPQEHASLDYVPKRPKMYSFLLSVLTEGFKKGASYENTIQAQAFAFALIKLIEADDLNKRTLRDYLEDLNHIMNIVYIQCPCSNYSKAQHSAIQSYQGLRETLIESI